MVRFTIIIAWALNLVNNFYFSRNCLPKCVCLFVFPHPCEQTIKLQKWPAYKTKPISHLSTGKLWFEGTVVLFSQSKNQVC